MKPTIDEVMTVVARHFGVTVADLKGPGRAMIYAAPRFLAVNIALQVSGKSITQLAYYLGKDRNTVRNITRQQWDREAMLTTWEKLTTSVERPERTGGGWAPGNPGNEQTRWDLAAREELSARKRARRL